MSGNNKSPSSLDGSVDANTQAIVQPWIDYWMTMFEQNTEWTKALMAGAPPAVEFTTLRSQWLETMSKRIDAYLRSPTFLEGMKRNAESMTATKVSTDLAKMELARQAGIPHIEDIPGLYDRLETAHELVLSRLQAIYQRLAALEHKLESQTQRPQGA